jgi:hypothetical protein
MEPEARPNSPTGSASDRTLRRVVATAIFLAVILYVTGIILGRIPEQRKLGGADVSILVIAILLGTLLLRPQILERLTHLKVGSVEFELEKLQQDQDAQRKELDNVRFVLTLLLQHAEMEHLRNLNAGNTQNYVGSHALRSELRRLRTLGLISNCNGHKISELTDKRVVDLKTVVQLTARGREYLEKLGDYQE